jgi:hypothetical protein
MRRVTAEQKGPRPHMWGGGELLFLEGGIQMPPAISMSHAANPCLHLGWARRVHVWRRRLVFKASPVQGWGMGTLASSCGGACIGSVGGAGTAYGQAA